MAEKIQWRKRARAFLASAKTGIEDKAVPKVRKPQRVKSYQWLCATGAGLRATTGRAWQYFQQLETSTVPPEEWPTISYTTDQGSDTQCAMHFLLASRVALMKVADPSHRLSNDSDLALSDEGLEPLVSLVSLIMGTDQGPWGQGRWHQSMKEATSRYLEVADVETCPIFNELLSRIALDLNEVSELHDPTWKQAVWSIRGAFRAPAGSTSSTGRRPS